jgi:shikimate kinase
MENTHNLSMPNLYLIGFMGVGKSAVGRAVARQLNMDFVDSDWTIERDAGQTIASIFANKGEPYFRKLEREFMESGHEKNGLVVSCGGGLPIAEGMGDLLLQKGIVICLFATPETIIRRTVGNPKRPLLNTPNPEQSVRTLLQEREPIYMQTGIGVSTEGRGIREIVKNVCRVYKREAKRCQSKDGCAQ